MSTRYDKDLPTPVAGSVISPSKVIISARPAAALVHVHVEGDSFSYIEFVFAIDMRKVHEKIVTVLRSDKAKATT